MTKFSEPVPVEILEERLRKLKELGKFGISLTGGEPTLHPNLPRIIRACRELRFSFQHDHQWFLFASRIHLNAQPGGVAKNADLD